MEEDILEQEVPNEEQAVMAVKLSDNVRDLIRKEVAEALMDPTFMATFNPAALADHLAHFIANHGTVGAKITGACIKINREYDRVFNSRVKALIKQEK